jgi:hypothetical protein
MLFSSSGLITLVAQAEGEGDSNVTSSTSSTVIETEETPNTGSSSEGETESDDETEEDDLDDDTVDEDVTDNEDDKEDDNNITATPRKTVTSKKKAVTVSASNDLSSGGDYDITNLMTQDSSIEVEVNGTYYTLEQLEQNGLKVPKGASVKVKLEWDAIPGIEAGQNLVYQIPDGIFSKIVDESFDFDDAEGSYAGTMTLSSSGLFTVEIDSNYFKNWTKKQNSTTLELDFLTLEFLGTLSSSRGETSGGDDAVIKFKDETTAEPKEAVEFTIPFEYKNENSPVKVKKESEFNAADKTITYTVKAITPSTNTMTSENVTLTDAFNSTSLAYLTKGSDGNGVYQSVKATLYTNTSDGNSLEGGTDISSQFTVNSKSGTASLNIGDMEPDSVAVLSYTVKVDSKYFDTTGSPIYNEAIATYNDITTDIGSNKAVIEESCSGSVQITKNGNTIATDSNGTYILYTVTVTVPSGKVSGVTVQDAFTDDVEAIKELKDFSVADNVKLNDDKSFVWTVGDLNAGESKKLTYKAYLDPEAWEYDSSQSSSKAIQRKRTIKNTAGVYVGTTKYGEVTVTKEITKTWINKTGNKNDSTGNVSYTLRVNSNDNNAPLSSNVTTIYDSLTQETATGGATIVYPITMKVYDYSSGSKQQVTSVSLDKTTAGMTATDTSWSLDLATYDDGSLSGKPYYYEFTYTVTGTGSLNNVGNGAGIGLGSGGVRYTETTSVEVKSISSYKRLKKLDYVNGYCTWESTMQTDIDAGSVYTDWLSDDNVVYGLWWFTLDQINAVEVYQGDELIYSQAKGVNTYNITVAPVYGSDKHGNGSYSHTDPVVIPYYEWSSSKNVENKNTTKFGQVGYCGFKLTFGSDVAASEKAPVTIRYNISVCKENIYWRYRKDGNVSDTKNANGFRLRIGNYPTSFTNKYKWELSSGLTKTEQNGGERNIVRYEGTEDLLKASEYDETDGIITWRIYVNRQGDMIGDATVVDTLPAGLEYLGDGEDEQYKTTLTYGESTGTTDFDSNFSAGSNTQYGNIKKDGITTETLDNGDTKITIELENLKGYSYNTYTQNEDGTYTLTDTTMTSYGDTTGRESSWADDGVVVLTIYTRITDELMMKGLNEVTNDVTVTNATMAYGTRTTSATQKLDIATFKDNLDKSMEKYAGGTTLTFNMTINSNAEDLVYNSDTLEIMDVMSSKMSLATHKNNYFVVTDVTDADNPQTLTAATSEDSIGADQYYVTKVESTDSEDADGEDADGEDASSEDSTAYKIIVPDGKKIKIQYLVMIDAAVGETVQISNKAYFNYEGLQSEEYTTSVNQELKIIKAEGRTGAHSGALSFQIYKQDQWGNPVEGVTFALYKVETNDDDAAVYEDGTVKGEFVEEKTTDKTGYVEFYGKLEEDAAYYFVETKAPTGYAINSEPTYFYFNYNEKLNIPSAIGIDYFDKVFTVTNTYSAASLTVPLKKTINGEDQATNNEFTFTLSKTSGDDVYSSEDSTEGVSSIQATIKGSGTTSFDTLYFKSAGDYTFTLKEDDLTEAETNEGFEKSDREYTISVKVIDASDPTHTADGKDGLHVETATYTWTGSDDSGSGDLLNNDTPTFDNTLTLAPVTVDLTATKKLDGDRRYYDITEGEFTFEVIENWNVVAIGKTTNGSETSSDIEFTWASFDDKGDIVRDENGDIIYDQEGLTYTQNKLGKHTLTIREVSGDDSTIKYTTTTFYAKFDVEPAEGEAKLKDPTITYSTRNAKDLDDDGKPVFTNTYTYTSVTPTGVHMDYLPLAVTFALIAVVAISGGLVFIYNRKRR